MSNWIELAAQLPNGRFVRNRFVRVEDKEAISDWRRQYGNTDVYSSICSFAEPSRSSPYICDFFLDIDVEGDLEKARLSCLAACDLLIHRLEISSDCLDLAFSGSKGFHTIIPMSVFSGCSSSHLIYVWKSLAVGLRKRGVEHVDDGIYQHSRLIRLSNSIHSKSRLFKVPLDYKELRDFDLRDILDLAKSPREEDSMAIPEVSDKASWWFRDTIVRLEQKSREHKMKTNGPDKVWRGWRTTPCLRALASTTLPDGVRHAAYRVLASFNARIGMHPDEAIERIHLIDARHPIRDTEYIERIVDWAYEKARVFPRCDQIVLQAYCKPESCFRGHERKMRDADVPEPKKKES